MEIQVHCKDGGVFDTTVSFGITNFVELMDFYFDNDKTYIPTDDYMFNKEDIALITLIKK